jgi:hypothetical protein
VIPLGSFYPPGTDFNTTLNQWLQKSDFVLVDAETSAFETYLIYGFIKDDFGVYASKDGVILLKRNYSGNPVLFVSYYFSTSYTYLNLADWESKYPAPIYIPPGDYNATFRLAANSFSSIASISVTGFPLELNVNKTGTESTGYKFSFSFKPLNDPTIVYSSTELSGSGFQEKFSLDFSLNVPGALKLNSTIKTLNDASVYLYWINVTVTQLRPFPYP